MNEKSLRILPFLLGLAAAILAFLYEPKTPLQISSEHQTENKIPVAVQQGHTNIVSTLSVSVKEEPVPPVSTESATTNKVTEAKMPPSIPALPEHEPYVQVVSSGPSTSKRIALTFDDGPRPLTLKVLDVLRERNVKATFFVLGDCVRLYPWILQQTVAEGHEIGNHTYTHLKLRAKASTDEVIDNEITKTQNEIKNAIGYETFLFRPPYGVFRPETRTVFHEHNLSVVLWSVDTLDWLIRDSDQIIRTVTNHTRNGSIILCHDIHKSTVEALPVFLDALLKEGYEFTTVSQLCGLPPLKLITASNSQVSIQQKP